MPIELLPEMFIGISPMQDYHSPENVRIYLKKVISKIINNVSIVNAKPSEIYIELGDLLSRYRLEIERKLADEEITPKGDFALDAIKIGEQWCKNFIKLMREINEIEIANDQSNNMAANSVKAKITAVSQNDEACKTEGKDLNFKQRAEFILQVEIFTESKIIIPIYIIPWRRFILKPRNFLEIKREAMGKNPPEYKEGEIINYLSEFINKEKLATLIKEKAFKRIIEYFEKQIFKIEDFDETFVKNLLLLTLASHLKTKNNLPPRFAADLDHAAGTFASMTSDNTAKTGAPFNYKEAVDLSTQNVWEETAIFLAALLGTSTNEMETLVNEADPLSQPNIYYPINNSKVSKFLVKGIENFITTYEKEEGQQQLIELFNPDMWPTIKADLQNMLKFVAKDCSNEMQISNNTNQNIKKTQKPNHIATKKNKKENNKSFKDDSPPSSQEDSENADTSKYKSPYSSQEDIVKADIPTQAPLSSNTNFSTNPYTNWTLLSKQNSIIAGPNPFNVNTNKNTQNASQLNHKKTEYFIDESSLLDEPDIKDEIKSTYSEEDDYLIQIISKDEGIKKTHTYDTKTPIIVNNFFYANTVVVSNSLKESEKKEPELSEKKEVQKEKKHAGTKRKHTEASIWSTNKVWQNENKSKEFLEITNNAIDKLTNIQGSLQDLNLKPKISTNITSEKTEPQIKEFEIESMNF